MGQFGPSAGCPEPASLFWSNIVRATNLFWLRETPAAHAVVLAPIQAP